MDSFKITEQESWNVDQILENTTSIKDLLSFEFNEPNDNIARNHRVLVLMYEKISKIESILKSKGVSL